MESIIQEKNKEKNKEENKGKNKGKNKEEKKDIRKVYESELEVLKGKLMEQRKEISDLEEAMSIDKNEIEEYYRIVISNEFLELVGISCEMSGVTEKYLNRRGDEYLNEGRKGYFRALIELEKVVGDGLLTGLNENKEIVGRIKALNPKRMLILMRKLDEMLGKLEKGYGEQSKYKWSFVDMRGRYVVIFKNILNYRELLVNDPRKEYYVENVQLIEMFQVYMQKVSERFRDKYLLATKELSDIKRAIDIQSVLKVFMGFMGLREEAELNQKTIDSWKQILEKEEKEKKKEVWKGKRNRKK